MVPEGIPPHCARMHVVVLFAEHIFINRMLEWNGNSHRCMVEGEKNENKKGM